MDHPKHPKPPPLRPALERQRREKAQIRTRPQCELTGFHNVNIITGICSFCGKKPSG